jgi:hypothetical protein
VSPTSAREHPARRGWSKLGPDGRYAVTTHRVLGLCSEHATSDIGICSCAGTYGATGIMCETCREIREHLVQRPRTV